MNYIYKYKEKKSSIVIFTVISIIIFSSCSLVSKKTETPILNENATGFKITSQSFIGNGGIPQKYTCKGDDVNPPLEIFKVPEKTQSLTIIMDDPDAPSGTFDHWILWNIDPKTTKINENSSPQNSITGQNSFGENKYGGPCPPAGEHRYFFKLYSLDTKIDLLRGSTKNDLLNKMEGHIIEKTELVGTFAK